MKIWKCPQCGHGHRAPQRMRRDNALKYCLKCSAKTGKLVERSCPSLEQERRRKAEAARLDEQKRKELIAAKSASYAQTEKGQLEAKCREYLKLDAFGGLLPKSLVMYDIRLARPRKREDVSLVRREQNDINGHPLSVTYEETTTTKTFPRPALSTGRAYVYQGRFVITAGTDKADAWATIIHEIAHIASPRDRGHGDQWRSVFAEAIFEVTGERPSGSNKYEFHDSARRCVDRFILRGERKYDQEIDDPWKKWTSLLPMTFPDAPVKEIDPRHAGTALALAWKDPSADTIQEALLHGAAQVVMLDSKKETDDDE